MNGTYKNWYNCIYVLESSPYFAHEPLENLWHQFSILPVCGMAGWSWLWNGCHWHCRSRPLRGEVHRLDLKPLGSRKMQQVTLIPSISIHLQHNTNSVAQRVGSIFVGCFAGWEGLLPPGPGGDLARPRWTGSCAWGILDVYQEPREMGWYGMIWIHLKKYHGYMIVWDIWYDSIYMI